ncbi:hypothetical protein PV04_00234 [Phialophora macrospora]|uniref:Uncharacterized protein n=1 Tax=Phialophora macrospora TaxID=1851006 RepID=A0A0D2FZX1_9EURO|nr:hypothetical protein PV04_00234 [Phialophora macrospora]
MTCAVIRTEAFRGPPASGLEGVNSTLVFGSNAAFEYDVRDLSMVAPGYRLTTIAENILAPDSLDARLRVSDGFVTVVLLQAPDVYFSEPMDDLMFAAHQENNFPSGLRWSADNLINAAACVDQYLVCNNGTGVCSSWFSPEEEAAPSLLPSGLLNSNADQHAWNILQYILTWTSIHHTIYGRGSSALLAQRSLFAQNQESLGSQPWRDELNGWFGVSLAKLQLSVHAIARPTPFLPLDAFQAFPPDAGTLQLCKMVKFREGSYTNIHWPGFIATMVVCGLIGLIRVSHNVFRTWKSSAPASPQHSGSLLANSLQSIGHGSPAIPLTPVISQQQGAHPIPMTQAAAPPPTPPIPPLGPPPSPPPTPGSPIVASPAPSPPGSPSPAPLSPQMVNNPVPPAPSSPIGLP